MQPSQTINARGGINRLSQKELFGARLSGTAGLDTAPEPLPPTPTGFNVNIPDTIPSTSLTQGGTKTDVFAKRNQMEGQQVATQAGTQAYTDLLGRANAPLTGTPITNPDEYINQLLLNRPTQTQTQLEGLGQQQAAQTRGFAGELTDTQAAASQQFGVGEAQTALGETQSRIADRTVQLRQALRDFEVNAANRGVAREFVQSAKGKLQADAAAELADLSIIENAQLGNLQQAQAEVDRVIENKMMSFQFENQAIQQEIDNLKTKKDDESKLRAEQLQIALDTRNQNIQTQLANEKETRGYMAEAAANGADTGTLDAIRNSQSPAEAALLAGPFIGRLDREVQQANLANIYDQIRSRATATREAALKAEQEATTEQEKEQIKKTADTEQALELFGLTKDLSTMSGLEAAVGTGFKKTVIGAIPFVSGEAVAGTDRADFEATAERVANLLTLDNLDLMSGVLSETDIKILETAGSNLRNFNQSEDQYRKEIKRVNEVMQRTIQKNGITPEQAVFYGTLDAGDVDTFNSLWETL